MSLTVTSQVARVTAVPADGMEMRVRLRAGITETL
jgi:hypothetical protein